MDTPEISFCLPVYNSAERLERCLRAVLAQEGPSREILVVDNASTDDTVARARALLAGIPEARIVVNEKNLGRIENWNRCLDLARGRYVRFAMVNDVWLPGSVEMLLRAARAQPDAVLVYSRARIVQGAEAGEEGAPDQPPAKAFSSAEIIQHWCELGYNDTDCPTTLLIHREALRPGELRFRTDIPYCADFYFVVELAARGPVVRVAAESCLFFKGLPGRFANAGLQVKSYYAEARQCALLLGRLTAAQGREAWRGFGFLYGQYQGHRVNFGDAALPGYGDTLGLFKGSGPYLAQALKIRAGRSWHDLGLWTRHTWTRLAVKCGRRATPAIRQRN